MTDEIFQSLQQQLPSVQKSVPLAQFSWIKIGGPAEYFFVAKTVAELEAAILAARTCDLPMTLLGGGSKTLIADSGIKGLVIRSVHDDVAFDGMAVTAGSGYSLTRLALKCAERSMLGFEFAVGIPGTVGGAIRMNSGCFGSCIQNVLDHVQIIDAQGVARQLSVEECEYGYRSSVFQRVPAIILSATFRLSPGNREAITAVYKKNLEFRRVHQPLDKPTLGSTFKNVNVKDIDELYLDQYALREKTRDGSIGAGAIIDACGLKGLRIGDIQVSERHANFIENCGQATAEQVVMLLDVIKQRVRNEMGGLQLKEEIQYLGF